MTVRLSIAMIHLAKAYERLPDDHSAELPRYFIRMSINALTDSINESLGFTEPDRAAGDFCGRGPALHEEDAFYLNLREAGGPDLT